MIRKRLLWVVGLFTTATAATAVIGRWARWPAEGPAMALIVTAVGALLIGLAAGGSPPPEGGEQTGPAPDASLGRAEEER